MTYIVEGMTCEHCVRSVSEEVGAVPGVSGVDVDLETRVVTVRGDAVETPAADAAIRAAIGEAGYEVGVGG